MARQSKPMQAKEEARGTRHKAIGKGQDTTWGSQVSIIFKSEARGKGHRMG